MTPNGGASSPAGFTAARRSVGHAACANECDAACLLQRGPVRWNDVVKDER